MLNLLNISYRILARADNAGPYSSGVYGGKTILPTTSQGNNWWLWLVVAILILLAAGILWIWIHRHKRKADQSTPQIIGPNPQP